MVKLVNSLTWLARRCNVTFQLRSGQPLVPATPAASQFDVTWDSSLPVWPPPDAMLQAWGLIDPGVLFK